MMLPKLKNPRYISTRIVTAMCFLASIYTHAVTLEDYPYEIDPNPERFAEDIEKLMETTAPAPENAIIGVGSSSMRMWKDRIHEDLEGLTIVPRGFGGSHFTDVIHYVEKLILRDKPRAVLLYEGDNDTAKGKSPERVRDDLAFLVQLCRSHLPELRFYVISVKPSVSRANLWPVAQEANSLMKAYSEKTDGVTFIDITNNMFDEDGSMRRDIFIRDMLHLNNRGYDIWATAIADVLKKHELKYENK